MTQTLSWFRRRRPSTAVVPAMRTSQHAAVEPATESSILDATGCLVIVIDIETGNVVDLNRPTETVTGYGTSDLLDRPPWETIVVSEDRAGMKAAYDASVVAGLPFSYESTVATKAGVPRRVAWSGEFLVDEEGARTHLVMTGFDATAPATPSTSGLFGHLMRAATTTAFIATDLEGRVTFFSTGAEQLLGYSAHEMLGRVFPQTCFEPEQFAARAETMGVAADLCLLTLPNAGMDRRERRNVDLGVHERRKAGGDGGQASTADSAAPRAHDWTMVRKDGTQITVSVSVDPVTDTSGRLVGHLGVGHDITDQRITEDLLFRTLEMERTAVEKLRKLDQTKTEFVATVSHEIRTPMTSISGYTELLQEGAAGDLAPAQVEFVDAIGRNCDRLTALANDLLTLSSLESGTFRHEQADVDVCEVIHVAHAALQPVMAGRDLDVTVEMPPNPVIVRGDARSLERLVLNLVTNAVKFTEDGGWVRCKLRLVASRARLEVSDNGIGIPEEEQGELFTRFFRSSNAVERAIQGSGLGLTIVESIAHAHGGDISVVSAARQGTTFTVNLPLRDPGEFGRRRRRFTT